MLRAFIGPRLARLIPAFAASSLLASIGAPAAHACSLVPPWQYRQASRLEFIGVALPDTVFAGAGTTTFNEEPGHFGRGTSRPIHGQRVRVVQLGERARRALPPGVREVLLVPWDYDMSCQTAIWGPSARWVRDSAPGVFAARLRPRAHWAGDLPTLDIIPFLQPYRDPPPDTTLRAGVPARADGRRYSIREYLPYPRLTATRLLRLFDELWEPNAPLNSSTAQGHIARLRADTSLAGRYPTHEFIDEATERVAAAKLRAAPTCAPAPMVNVSIAREIDLPRLGIATVGAVQSDHHGGLWMLETNTRQVVRVDSIGRVVARIEAHELATPVAIDADSTGAVWVVDAVRQRVSHFAPTGTLRVHYRTTAAISAASLARDGDRVLVGQRVLRSDERNPAERVPSAFVRAVWPGKPPRADSLFDLAPPSRLAAAPLYDAPMVEALVAARPGGGAVVTYPLAPQLRFFDARGRLEREVARCTDGIDNEAALRSSSIEFGLQYRAFATMLQFDMQGVLSVLTATPNTAGHSRLDQFDGRGNLLRSAWLFDRQGIGVRLMGVAPAASSQELWAVSAGGRRVMRLHVDWW
jgi:hypothetical protein